MGALYNATSEGGVALAATVIKSVFGLKGDAGIGVLLKDLSFSFDGVTSSEKPVLVELCYATFATNPPGTASTAVTIYQSGGRTVSEAFSAAKNWTSEPTVLTVLEAFEYDPTKGMYRFVYPLGDEYDSAAGEGFVLRMTVPASGASVNARAGMRFGRV